LVLPLSDAVFPFVQDADLWYFGSLNMGSPPQALNIVFATGLADLFVVGSQCSGCLPSTPRFNSAQSSSYKAVGGPPVSVTLGDGPFNGTNSTESVNVGPFTIQDQGFSKIRSHPLSHMPHFCSLSVSLVLVTQIAPKLLSGSVSGQMGLGFAGLSDVNVNPFWQRLLQTNQLSAPDMSFYLTRYRGQIGVQPESPGGLFTLGGTNPLYYQGDIEFLPYPIGITPRYWMLELASMSSSGLAPSQMPNSVYFYSEDLTVGSTPIYILSALVAFDTATTLIGTTTSRCSGKSFHFR
jgi:cathepsin D